MYKEHDMPTNVKPDKLMPFKACCNVSRIDSNLNDLFFLIKPS